MFFFFFYETFLLLFLTKFLYEIANVSFYFIMYTDILHIIRILSISQFCLRELLRSLLFFIIYIHCCNLFSNADCYYYHYFAFNVSEQ